jgi:hypothetical protein
MRSCFVVAIALAAAVLPWPAGAQLFGTSTTTFVDFTPNYGADSVNFRTPGQVGSGYNPTYTGSQNVVLTQPQGLWSLAENYENGTYALQFDAPNPGAITVTVGGMFSAAQGSAAQAGHYTGTFHLQHDNPNDLLSGGGEIDLGGVSAANPVSHFRVTRPGGNPAALTPTYAAYLNEYRGVRWMNNASVNNNQSTLTAADLLPSGQNIGTFGTSYADQARMTGALPHARLFWTNVPVGADDSFVAGMTDQLAANLPRGMPVTVEYGNENWNFAFTHPGKILALAQADPRVPHNGDNFYMVAYESGLRTSDVFHVMLNRWLGDGRDAADLSMVIGDQGANQFFGDTAIAAAKSVNGGTLSAAGVHSRAMSFYPGDGITGAASVDDLLAQLYADLPRQVGYLKNEVTHARADGITPGIYEWSPNAYLTKGGISPALAAAFRADPRSGQWVKDKWAAITSILGPEAGSFAMEFTAAGDGWTPQIDPRSPHEPEQQAIDAISTGAVPEPRWPCLACAAAAVTRRRRAA